MKTNRFRLQLSAIFLLSELMVPKSGLCHDTPIHTSITENAASVSAGLTAFLGEQFGLNNSPFLSSPKLAFNPGSAPNMFSVSGAAPIVWMKKGSVMEDEEQYSFLLGLYSGIARPQNHFYTPTEVPAGRLTDGFAGIGTWMDSFSWAWQRNVTAGPSPGYQNHDSWQNARDYEYAGLTAGSKSARDQNLAHMLYSLGHVLHLNQDLSQPDHTRNDNHNPGRPTHDPHVWIEPYGLRLFRSRPDWFTPPPESERGWQWWRDAGFTKLEAFWDRNLYTGAYGNTAQDAKALNDDANAVPGAELGLAEFSNGNFLGEDAKYRDCWPSPIQKQYFQFPTLATSTTFPEILAAFSPYDEEVTYRDGSAGTHVYIRKIADGIAVPHHSRLTYLHSWTFYSNPRGGLRDTTINDSLVLNDYHAILLPKAVKYSAGILDYFFRGKLEVTFTSDPLNYHVHVVNRSGQQLKGGAFHLFCDDSAGSRNPVDCPGLTTAYTGGLADDASLDFDVARAQVATQFVLVYQGTIGVTGNAASDPVDDGIAIAVATFKPVCTQAFLQIAVEALPQPVINWLTCYYEITAIGGTIDDVHRECGWCPYAVPNDPNNLGAGTHSTLTQSDYQAALDTAQAMLASISFETLPVADYSSDGEGCPEVWSACYAPNFSSGSLQYERSGNFGMWEGMPDPNNPGNYLYIGPSSGAQYGFGGVDPCGGVSAYACKTKFIGYDHLCVSERSYIYNEFASMPSDFSVLSCGPVLGPSSTIDGHWAPSNPATWGPQVRTSFHGKVIWLPEVFDSWGYEPRPVPGCLDCSCTP
jgi:hypothetical protein